MVLLSELKPPIPKVLLWGKPGTGKTLFVTSFGAGMQLIDTDRGLLSAMKHKDQWSEHRAKVDVVECLENDPTKATAFDKFKSTILDITNQCRAGTYPFKVLAIDSFTTLADFALRQVVGNSGQLQLGKYTNPSQQQWGLAIGELDNIFMYIKALPIPVVTIFHNRESTEGTGAQAVTVQEIAVFGKNLPGKIISYFDEVLLQKMSTFSGKPDPSLQTVPDAFTIVRSRNSVPNGFKCNDGFRKFLETTGWKEESK
jgi:hypothetical protein